jgi:TM2 domain-containing membrane protein YozV
MEHFLYWVNFLSLLTIYLLNGQGIPIIFFLIWGLIVIKFRVPGYVNSSGSDKASLRYSAEIN